MRVLPYVVCAGIALATPARAQVVNGQLGARAFAITLPPGFSLATHLTPTPAVATYAYTSTARADGTRGLIQVTLLDLDSPAAATLGTLDQFAAAMTAAMRRRRTAWTQADTGVTMSGVPCRRVAWRGVSVPGPETPTATALQGVLISCVQDRVGISLSTQEQVAHADEVPAHERAMQTFALQAR